MIAIYLAVTSIVSCVLTYFTRKIAIKKSIMDLPNDRSSHTVPTPRGGGLAIAICWFLSISGLFFVDLIHPHLFYALISGLLLSAISLIDDIYSLSNKPRLIMQVVVAALGLYFIGGLAPVDLGFYTISNTIVLNTIAFIAIVWFINLFNFIDGIDGYSTSESLFIALVLYAFTGNVALLFLAFSLLGFLPWNWDKAKIFMGDVGSTLLGYTAIILFLYFHKQGEFSIFNGLIISSLFWFDATYTIIRRFINKENIGQAHRKHAFQRIVQYGFSHQKTVLSGMLINGLLLVVVYCVEKDVISGLSGLLIAVLLLFMVMKIVNVKKAF
jgi:Fuc2NAc and GlcNAc transferase